MHHATALENVALPLAYRGVRSRERYLRASRALSRVGLGPRLGHRPDQMFGWSASANGSIARALVTEPSLLLCDEPTGNLDSGPLSDVMSLLHGLHAEGRAIVIVTHDPLIAMSCQRTIRLGDGRVIGIESERGAA